MGKSNKRKNKKNKLGFNDKQNIKWEDLVGFKDEVVAVLQDQMATLTNLIVIYKDKIEGNTELQEKINGMILSYGDISKELRFNMEKHITFGFMLSSLHPVEYYTNPEHVGEYEQDLDSHKPDSINIVDNKKGSIEEGSDDFFQYVNIQTNYISLGMKLAALVQQPLFNIMLDLGVADEDKAKFEEIEKLALEKETEFTNDLMKFASGGYNGQKQ